MEQPSNNSEYIKSNEDIEIPEPPTLSSSSDEDTVDDTIDEVGNIYHNVKCTLINNKDKDFVKSLRDESYHICRELIPIPYIKHSFSKFTEGFVYNDDIGRRLGFCIWKVNEDIHKDLRTTYSLYIFLICSKARDQKLCRNIFYDLENYCKRNRIVSVSLEAANPDLEAYYETFGFRTESRLHGIKMTKYIDGINLFIKTKKNRDGSNTKQRHTQTRKKQKMIGDHVM